MNINDTNEVQVFKNLLICNKMNLQLMFNATNKRKYDNYISLTDILNKTLNDDLPYITNTYY
jgi:hypothetical protein